MVKKKLIIASIGGALALALVAGFGAAGGQSQKLARAGNNHSTHKSELKEIGFDWKDPTTDGFKPYWRCAECCKEDPSTSRFSDKDGKKSVSADDLRLSALTGVEKASISGDEITNLDSASVENVDQITTAGEATSVNEAFVSDGTKNAIYFSRSGVTGEGDSKQSAFAFSTSSQNVGSVTFSYRYLNFSSDASATAKFAYSNGNATSYDSASIALTNTGAWTTVTVNYSGIVSNGTTRTNFTGFGLSFADLRGYIMISGLSYQHGHVYNKDHICPEDGYSDPGKLAVDLDGELTDAKWTALSAENSLSDIASDGRGINVKGFTSGDYAYFGFEVYSNTGATDAAQILFNAEETANTAWFINGKSTWNNKLSGAVAKKEKVGYTLYKTTFEIVAKLSSVAASDGSVKAAFCAEVPDEYSGSSWNDSQPAYWVINRKNAWGTLNDAFSVDSTGIHHEHEYSTGACDLCGHDPRKALGYAVTLDGKLTDWSETVLATKASDSDSNGASLSLVGFTSGDYLYVAMQAVHKEAVYFDLIKSDGSTEIWLSESSGVMSVKKNGNLISDFYFTNSTNASTGYVTTTVEAALPLSSLGNAQLGYCVQAMGTNETSGTLHLSTHGWAGRFWVIKQLDPAAYRFSFGADGMSHEHSYQNGKCVICDADEPVSIDGDISDFPEAAKNTKKTTAASNGESISLSGFADDSNAYLGIEVKTTSADVSGVDLLGKDYGTTSYRYSLTVAGGVISSTNAKFSCASTRSYDGSSLYSYTFEIAVMKSAFTAETDGSVKIGICVNGCAENSTLSCNPTNAGQLGYWGIGGYNGWWGEAHCFIFSSSGVANPSVAS